jgi:protein O-GlcNAc transferase
VALAPDAPFNAAMSLIDALEFERGEAALRRLLQKYPRDHRINFTLGQRSLEKGQPEQGLYLLTRAIELAPEVVEYQLELAWSYRRLRQHAKALAIARIVAERAPHRYEAHAEIADAARALGQVEDSAAALERALAIRPRDARLSAVQGAIYSETGRAEEALAPTREAATLDPGFVGHWCNYAYAACSSSSLSPEDLFAAHREVGESLFYPGDQPPLLVRDVDPERKLRVGILSPDLVRHSVTYFFEGLAERLDKSKFELVAYFSSSMGDEVTERLKKHFVRWHDLPGGKESDLAELIRNDRIDIAIDLAGYTEASLIWVLRRRVAPVQAMYLGYPHSSGLTSMDYRIVDAVTDPPGDADALATERLVRMPGCFLCYRPPPGSPAVPALEAGQPVRFGSFNRLVKISAATRRLWGRIMHAVPGSRLVLKDKIFVHEQGRRAVERLMEAEGISADRLDLLARSPDPIDHLSLYGLIDVGLDTLPYNGTTTTCEALWMGVPVITAPGRAHVSRVSASILKTVGLDELIASDEDDYVRRAVALAGDRDRLATYRATLRGRMQASPLMDEAGHAARFGDVLRAMWREKAAQLRGGGAG